MSEHLKILLFLLLIFFGTKESSFAQKMIEKGEIEVIIKEYENSLNKEDLTNVMSLFSKDAVIVLQGTPTSIGAKSIANFYKKIFSLIDFNLSFDIKEVVIMSSEWAFVRTITRNVNSKDNSEEGHEIFLLTKNDDKKWEIARYAGSSAK